MRQASWETARADSRSSSPVSRFRNACVFSSVGKRSEPVSGSGMKWVRKTEASSRDRTMGNAWGNARAMSRYRRSEQRVALKADRAHLLSEGRSYGQTFE